MTMLRSQFSDLYLEDALPQLEMIIQEQYSEFPKKYTDLFNVKDMKASIIQSAQVSSLKPPVEVAEGAQIPLQSMVQGFSKTYKALKYAGMLAVSQEALDDEGSEIFTKAPRAFARAFNETEETLAAAVLNGGFSDTGPDGVSLFSAAHPALVSGVANQSNLLGTAADLSSTSIKAMYSLLRATKDTAGNRIQIKPKKLIVGADDEFLAYELLNSTLLPNSGNESLNAVNSPKDLYNVMPIVWDYLTSSDAYFVAGDKIDHNLCFYWRKRPVLSSDTEFKSEVALTKMTMRLVCGYSDWRGIVASAGTGS
jgi:hypothetical protein